MKGSKPLTISKSKGTFPRIPSGTFGQNYIPAQPKPITGEKKGPTVIDLKQLGPTPPSLAEAHLS